MLRILLCIFVLISQVSIACEFKIGVREYPPYSFKETNGDWSGIDIDIFNFLMSEINCDKEYIKVTFGQGVQLLKDGKLDGLSQMSITQDRQLVINFIGPIRSETLSLLTSNDVSEKINDFIDITKLPYVFGKRKGTFIGEEFSELMKHNADFSSKFIEMDSANPRIDLVLKGRIVGFFDEQAFNRFMLKHSTKYSNMKLQPLKIHNGLVYLGFSKKSVSEAKFIELTKAFERLKATGGLSQLSDRE